MQGKVAGYVDNYYRIRITCDGERVSAAQAGRTAEGVSAASERATQLRYGPATQAGALVLGLLQVGLRHGAAALRKAARRSCH